MRHRICIFLLSLGVLLAAAPAHAQNVGAPTVVRRALLKNSTATSYLVEIVLTGRNLPTSTAAGQPRDMQRGATVNILRMNMRYARGNLYGLARGWYPVSLGFPDDRGMEFVLADGIRYQRGPIARTRQSADEWYETGNALTGPLTTQVLLSLGGPRALDSVNIGGVRKIGDETITGSTCDIYSGVARQSALRRYLNIGQRSLPFGSALSSSPTSQIEFSICEDGYVYRVRETATFTTQQGEAELILEVRFSNFDSSITVVAPRTGVSAAEAFTTSPAGEIVVAVVRAARMRSAPLATAELLGLVSPGQEVTLLERTADSRWYRVTAPAGEGWLTAPVMQLTRAIVAQVPIGESLAPPPPATSAPTETSATTAPLGTPTPGTATPARTPTPTRRVP